jgi:AraC-like DNA-binding protein
MTEGVGRLRTDLLPDGSCRFEDEFAVHGEVTARVVTCTAWLLELLHVREGGVAFVTGETEVRPAGPRFGVLYPPFTVARLRFEAAAGHVVGLAATAALPRALAAAPHAFETDFDGLPAGAADAVRILVEGRGHRPVESAPHPSPLSRRAKDVIDREYLDCPPIARIAALLGVSHEHLSRQFKRDYGLSPSAYLHHVRLADAPLRLARGQAIVGVSEDAGYNDLGRFYKQFRKLTRSSPGACRESMGAPRPRRRGRS